MRLVFVAADFSPTDRFQRPGGIELARALAGRGLELDVVAPAEPADPGDHSFPGRIHRVPGSADTFPVSAAATLVRLQRQADVTYFTSWSAALMPRTMSSLLPTFPLQALLGHPRRPTLIAAQGPELLEVPLRVPFLDQSYDRLRLSVLRNADRVVAVSQFTRGLLLRLGLPRNRCAVVPPGVDTMRFRPLDASGLRRELDLGDAPVVLAMGPLRPRSGIDRVLAAFARVVQQHPRARLLIGGSGPAEPSLRKLAGALRLLETDSVRFVGQPVEDDLPRWYSLADVFVLPVTSEPPEVEGFGVAFMEAGACGVACVGPDEGGPREAVIAGETGLLVPPRELGALATAMDQLLSDADLRRRLGAQARARAERELGWSEAARRLETIVVEAVDHATGEASE